ncbi:MAG: DUF433 domain-containing protein [Dehalococcoidia bacterium]
MQASWRDYIVSTSKVLRGKPRIKGTRILASLVLGYLAAGETMQKIGKELPELTGEQTAVLAPSYPRARIPKAARATASSSW